jgi:hypothetical protein
MATIAWSGAQSSVEKCKWIDAKHWYDGGVGSADWSRVVVVKSRVQRRKCLQPVAWCWCVFGSDLWSHGIQG